MPWRDVGQQPARLHAVLALVRNVQRTRLAELHVVPPARLRQLDVPSGPQAAARADVVPLKLLARPLPRRRAVQGVRRRVPRVRGARREPVRRPDAADPVCLVRLRRRRLPQLGPLLRRLPRLRVQGRERGRPVQAVRLELPALQRPQADAVPLVPPLLGVAARAARRPLRRRVPGGHVSRHGPHLPCVPLVLLNLRRADERRLPRVCGEPSVPPQGHVSDAVPAGARARLQERLPAVRPHVQGVLVAQRRDGLHCLPRRLGTPLSALAGGRCRVGPAPRCPQTLASRAAPPMAPTPTWPVASAGCVTRAASLARGRARATARRARRLSSRSRASARRHRRPRWVARVAVRSARRSETRRRRCAR